MSINKGEALVIGKADGAECSMVVTPEGEFTCSDDSDPCPFDNGWPDPPAAMVAEAAEVARGSLRS
jgi:hypothetical protein